MKGGHVNDNCFNIRIQNKIRHNKEIIVEIVT